MSTHIAAFAQSHNPLCQGSIGDARARQAPFQPRAQTEEMLTPTEPLPSPPAREDGEMTCARLVPVESKPAALPDILWDDLNEEPWQRVVWPAAWDKHIKRIDQAVIAGFLTLHGTEPFPISAATVDELCARHANWGARATPNKMALSLKRLFRRGYLSYCPEEIYRLGIDTKKTPAKLKAEVFARDGHACKHCGATENLQADHVVPRCRGGETVIENLQTLCLTCNVRKGDS